MTDLSLNITIVDKRMYTLKEAANYAGLSVKMFPVHCSVQPIEIRPHKLLWDKRDLDIWIDRMKDGFEETTQAAILEKLL